MKAYKVVMAHTTYSYGKTNKTENAKYFFNKKEAEKFYKTGERAFEVTAIYRTYADGSISRSQTGAIWYEKEVKEARKNERVVKETIIENDYKMEEIEIN